MKIAKLIEHIEKIAPLQAAAPWDKSGVQVASYRDEVTHLAVMLDPTSANIEKALSFNADFLLAHHPLSMTPHFPDKTDSYHNILSLLFRNDICLYSSHTSLDANPQGPVSWLARNLELQNSQLLEITDPQGFGFGFVGDLPHAVNYFDFCRCLAKHLEKCEWSACGPEPELVRRVACCPGSGTSMINDAANAGADVFITGDLKYHTALDATIRLLDVGHFQLEEIMMRKFSRQLAKELPGLRVSFIPSADPIVREKFDDA